MTTRVVIAIALITTGIAPWMSAQAPAWPAGRARHHMVYDPGTQQVLLLGGAQAVAPNATRDTPLWSWNGSLWRSTPTSMPLRANEAVALDSTRGRLVVHGGSALAARGELDDTWEFDAQAWRLVSEAGPGARAHHAMVFDAIRNQMVLFGNSDSATTNDTWGWDGRTWKLLAGDGPPRRGVHALAYDTTRGVVVMFGGAGSRNTLLNDTWEWDGRQWTQITTATPPSPRFDTAMTYDPIGGRVILFGGRGPTGNLGDTWAYDGRSWVRLDAQGPSARNGAAMVYDPRAKAVLLFGGRNEPAFFNDLWAFDGAWRQIPQH